MEFDIIYYDGAEIIKLERLLSRIKDVFAQLIELLYSTTPNLNRICSNLFERYIVKTFFYLISCIFSSITLLVFALEMLLTTNNKTISYYIFYEPK